MDLECDRSKCLYCGACVGTCPVEALTLYSSWVDIDHDTCTECGICVRLCPVGAMSLGGASE